MIPVSVVTGFLGSGKTTLIRRILAEPAFTRTAVIVNEFGEVALDHALISSSDESVLTLNTGCLCCAVQTDLARTLMDLFARREAGLAEYDRVLIETSGLSDPAPMLQAMMIDADVAATHRIVSIVTVVDAVNAKATLDQHAEARHQVALADRLLISKTDLCPLSDGLQQALHALNPLAPRRLTAGVEPLSFFHGTLAASLPQRLAGMGRSLGHAGLETFTLVRERPVPALALTMLLQALAEHCGPRLLRLKGLVSIEEMPGRPAVIHGVRHIVSAPEFLERWPDADETTRVVFITKGVPRHFAARLLDAIEEEVRQATTSTAETGPIATSD